MRDVPPRILIVAPSAYPLGGVQTWLDYLVPGLRDAGLDVSVGLPDGCHHNVERYLAVHPLQDVERISCVTGSREGRVRAVQKLIERVGADLVLGVNSPDAYSAAARARRAGQAVRVAMTVHGIQPDLFEDVAEYHDILDGVVCTNRLASRLAVEIGGIEDTRVAYAPYGVPDAQPVRRDAFGSGRLRIAFVGRIESFQKRVEDLVAIVGELERRSVPFELAIAGSGPREAWLRNALAAPRERGSVRFLGVVPADQLEAEVYAQTDALLITSSWETGPIVAWEAMAARLPVVTSAYVGYGLEGALADGQNCLVYPVGDAAAAVDALLQVRDADVRRRLSVNGRALVERRYSRSASIEAWVSACRDLLARQPRAGSGSASKGAPQGRLDRMLGSGPAETVRRLLGRRHPHEDAGGEWPHSYGRRPETDPAFWSLAVSLDRRSAEHTERTRHAG